MGRMQQRTSIIAAVLLVVSAAAGAAQVQGPSTRTDGVWACVELVGADEPVDPTALSPAALTQGILDGRIRIASVDATCTGPSPTGDPQPSGTPAALSVEARDLAFAPSELELPAGVPATLDLHNAGRVTHNLTIDAPPIQVVVSPGATARTAIAGLAPGTYPYYCSVSGHREAGMVGTITVR
jgi:plastocyanin